MATAVYGNWYDFTAGSNTRVEDDVAAFVSSYEDDKWRERLVEGGHFDEIVKAYREAINDKLPDGVCLAGDIFYGPYPSDQHFGDDYPAHEDGSLDIATIIAEVDLGEIVAQHDPDYTALIGTSPDAVTGHYCDVVVIKEVGVGTPEFQTDLPVRVDDDDKLVKVTSAADRALEAAGWRRVDPWEYETDGLHATVTRA